MLAHASKARTVRSPGTQLTSSGDTMHILEDAARRAVSYLGSLETRPVRPDPDAVARLDELFIPAPKTPTPEAEVLAHLDDLISPATMAMAGPRFFGFVIGGSLPVTVAVNWLATAWDQNACFDASTPGVSRIEEAARRWLLELLDLPRECAVGFVTGATVANFTALAAARHAVLKRSGWNVEADGLFGAPPVQVVVGEEVHPSLVKALGMLGFGRSRVTRVPVDAQGRMRADKLPRFTSPAILCVQAGNVNSGSFDPFPELCAAAREAGAWVHVDGAFGLWARASQKLAPLTRGLELADSWATDAHKWLNVPYDSGLAFVRDAHALQAAMAITAEYLPAPGGQRNPADYTPELSRRARGIEIYAALKSLGREGLARMVERNCVQAQRFAEGLRSAGFAVLNDVVLNQVVVSFGEDARTRKVIEAIQRDGTCWAGVTVWQGQTGMRISVSSWATSDADVERSLQAIVRCAKA